MNVLVVDDIEMNRKLLRVNLEAEGHVVFDAADGVSALAVLEHEKIDAVISDVLMPRMDGFRLCREIRKHERLSALPFIIYTSTYKSPGDKKMAELAGADKYIVKPAPIAIILEALVELTTKTPQQSRRLCPVAEETVVIQEYNAALVRKLEERNVELEQRNQLANLASEVALALTRGDTLPQTLQNCTASIVSHLDAAFARIWILNEKENILELQASAGMYTHLDGPHGRVPMGKFKIGLIAEERKPHLTNSVIGDPRVPNQEWAKRERLVAFAGYPLIVEDRLMGVVAMFSRHELPEATLNTLATISDSIALWIQHDKTIAEQRQLEEQFRQSQKMEAVGQLAGGVAHDFNNILTAIIMHAELLAMAENIPEEVADGLRQIRGYSERAASLTRQLLLFGRKQVMQPRDLDLNDLVTGLAKMLQRVIGEDVRLQLRLHPKPLITHADAGMLDQVLMNLTVNARDAMPNGGLVLIETAEKEIDEDLARLNADAQPGRFVWLCVSDKGSGIPPEVLPKIFEPFFTTKERGKGTGLGLATVFGIIKQHHGWIRPYSEPGQGTSFQIFLPASEAPPAVAEAAARPKVRSGSETILLVEDDTPVRLLTQAVLERHGYKVLEAINGAEALNLWPDHRDQVALLLTDLVMPGGVSGQELFQKLKADRSNLKVIFSSGYSPEIAGKALKLRSGENFLQKPSPPEQLLETIRRCLDG